MKAKPAATWEPIDRVTGWERNPRDHDEAHVDDIAAEIDATVWGDVIVAREGSGQIISGHGRLLAARKLGHTTVPVRFVDVTDAQAARMNLAHNRLTEAGRWNDDRLVDVLRGLKLDEVDVSHLGWSPEELHALLHPKPQAKPDDDSPPVPEAPVSVREEVYALGPHRLLCGDATDPEAWAFLGDERLRMVWTDPPYGVHIVGGSKDARNAAYQSGRSIDNDDLAPDELRAFVSRAFAGAHDACADGAAWYVAAPPGPLFAEFGHALGRHGVNVWRQTLVWLKQQMVFGRSDYHYRHEPVFYGWRQGAAHHFAEDRTQDTVLEFDRPMRSDKAHPTVKPIALVQRCIENSSLPGWLVGDPFAGSGTTLLACAASGRVARCIELDPRYCDVIRRRWTRYAVGAGVDPGPGALEG